MKLEVKRQLETYFDIKNEKLINKIIWALKGRQDCYGEVGLSRCENSKFNTSERQLSAIIKILREKGLLILTDRRKGNNNNFLCNVYKLSSELKQILSMLQTSIEFLNEKIIEFNKYANIQEILNSFGIHTYKNKIGDKKSKITFSRRINVITNWKTQQHYSLFNYLKASLGLPVRELFLTLNLG